MNNDFMELEIREAIDAGERALVSLRAARENLNSAKNWGYLDMFGGNFLTGMLKYSKLNDATNCLERAKNDLLRFQKELKDVNLPLNIRMEIGGFLSFADFFFDGIVADYLVQSKIADAKEQVEDAVRMVEDVLRNLRRL